MPEEQRSRHLTQIAITTTNVEALVSRFDVRVEDDDGSATEHDVTLSRADHERLGGRFPDPEDFIRACFDFLLERESKGSILRSFDVSQIATYFPSSRRRSRPREGRYPASTRSSWGAN
jgi:hypothetical protein